MKEVSIKKNTLLNFVKTFSSIVFPLITFPYITRILGVRNVGKINFGLSIISYFSLIASLGITTYAIRECSAVRNDRKKLDTVASQIFSINFYTTVMSYCLLFFTLLFYKKLSGYRTLIVIQSLVIVFNTFGTDWINSAMEDFSYITKRTLFFQVLSLVLMFVFVRHSEDYIKYAVICLISSSGANIVNIWYRRKYCTISLTRELEVKKHITPILLLFVMMLAQDVFSSVDSTMLGIMHGDYEVGIYTTAQKIYKVVSQVVSSILWVIMPRMSLYFEQRNYYEINRLLRKLLGFNLLLGLPCATGLVLLAKDIILLVGGEGYIDSAPVLQICMLGFVFALFGGNLLGNAILLPSKNERYYMIACVATAIINIITNYIFIPDYGPLAAAGTTAFCSLCMLLMLLFKVNKSIRIHNVIRLVVSPLTGCIVIAFCCQFSSHIENLYLRTVLSVISSGIGYVITQVMLKNELAIELLSSVKQRLEKTK